MFGQSRLIQGLLCETNEAVAAQVTLWDRSTVWHAGIEQVAKTKLATAASDYLNEKVVAPVQRARKTMTGIVPEWIGVGSAALGRLDNGASRAVEAIAVGCGRAFPAKIRQNERSARADRLLCRLFGRPHL